MKQFNHKFAALLCAGFTTIGIGQCQAPTPAKSATQDLASMDLDQLMKVQVTTVSKHAQKLSDVPAAIYVVTQEAIRRSCASGLDGNLKIESRNGLQVRSSKSHEYQTRGSTRVFVRRRLKHSPKRLR